MNNLKTTTLIVIAIGSLSILFSVIALFNGQSFSSQLWGLFIGVVLIGTALIERGNQGGDAE